MPATKEQKEEAKGFVELIKKAKGSTKIYFAVGKGSSGEAVHIDKKKAKACAATLKTKGVSTPLASGQVLFDGTLTLACLKPSNENAVRKAFATYFKSHEVSIPGVSESSIVVLGPKDWDSAAEDEVESGASEQTTAPASAASPAPASPAPAGLTQAGLLDAWKALVPDINARVASEPALRDPASKGAKEFEELLKAGRLDQASHVLERIQQLIHSPSAAGNKRDELIASWKKLVPEIEKAVAANPALRDPAGKAAKEFEQAIRSGNIEQAAGRLDAATELVRRPAAAGQQEATEAGATGAEFNRRYDELKPRLMEALKMPQADASTLRSGITYAVEKANAKDFAAALKALERIERLVGEAIAAPANEQTGGVGTEKNALAGWQSARGQVIASLKELEGKIRAMAVPEGDEAIILVKAIQANLTENPSNLQQAAELEQYLKTDSIITDAESPNGFGIKISIRQPLLEALSKLKPQLQA